MATIAADVLLVARHATRARAHLRGTVVHIALLERNDLVLRKAEAEQEEDGALCRESATRKIYEMVAEAYAAEVVAGVAVGGLDAVAARDGTASALTLDELVVALPLGEIGGGDGAEGEGDDGEDGGEGAHCGELKTWRGG